MPSSIIPMLSNEEKRKNKGVKKLIYAVQWVRTKKGYKISLFILFLILLLSIMISCSIGVGGGDLKTLIYTVIHPKEPSEIGRIMVEMRMPRAVAACFTGAAFALSGCVMQGITKNPLADSGLLGINAGAGFFVALTAVIFPSMPAFVTTIFAFLGAAMAVLLVYGLGMGKHKTGSVRLILAGSAVSAFLTALSQGISLTFGISKSLSFWTAGSLTGITWQQLIFIIPWITGFGCVSIFISEHLSVLALGEENAIGLGVNVQAIRLIGIAAVLVMAGASVSLVGGISFLGLIVPHSARFIVGEDYKRLLPMSALLGAILLVLADIAARMIHAPFDTPVGALVVAIGVPFFLVLTYRKKGAVL